MIITVKKLPETTPQEIIDSYCNRFRKKGKKVKTEHKDGNIIISIEEIFDD